MRKVFTILFLIAWAQCYSQELLPGFQAKVKGEDLLYHAPQPDAPVSLLVRSEDSARFIEWKSAPLPVLQSYSPAVLKSTFLLLAGIDVNPADPHSWKVFVNGRNMFTISSPADTVQQVLTWPGPDGSSLVFRTKEVDKYGDLMGYLFCTLPASMLEPGKPVSFRVVGESAGSRTWFMVFQYVTTDQVRLIPEQAVMKGKKGNYQVLRAEIIRYADPQDVSITVAGTKLKKHLEFGYNALYLPVPEISRETNYDLLIKAGKIVIAEKTFAVSPVKQRTIYLLHHSHHDIGYTHVQPEVEEIQIQNLDRALKMIDSTKNYPEGAQMKWCSEVMWAVDTYYRKASPEQKQALLAAVKSGNIELNGLYTNELVSLCGPEELDRLLESGRVLAKECGVELSSAMITDIPGWSWALVPALANSGVKYLSLGTNRNHRIGSILEEWGDKPFYWLSPSGEEKVLCWIHGEGYSLFHTGLAYNSIRNRLREDLIFNYMDKLSSQDYPYEEVMLRYNIGSDNGPVDETLPQAVKEWNEKYTTPRVVISTVGEAFSQFESKHGSGLPEVSGDLTCYWEDGAYSTAAESILNRRNASRLIQAQALWTMFNPAKYPREAFREAWRSVLLFDEHTWGSWNSISEPDAQFTTEQWEIKRSFALEAEKQSRKLVFDAMSSKLLGGPGIEAVEVINACGWDRSGLVTVSGGAPGTETLLFDRNNNPVSTQLLSDGNIAFIANKIPAFGSTTYIIKSQSPNRPIAQSSNRPIAQSFNLQTSAFFISIDSLTGAISSLIWKSNGRELVDRAKHSGLNEYNYVAGRVPDKPLKAVVKEISIAESGPVFTTIRVVSEAPGCNKITTSIRLIDEPGFVEVINTYDKQKVLSPEAVHLAFPFDVPGGTLRYDLAYGYCRPEKDQIAGSNKNYLAMEHWVDISNDNFGVTVICPDAPLFEAGTMSMDAIVTGWLDSLAETQTFYSYLMNNYWETNFAASQQGMITARYIIVPHDGFDPAFLEKEAIGQRQPLLARKGGGWLKGKTSLFRLENPALVITSIKPATNSGQVLATVYNAGKQEQIPQWSDQVTDIKLSDPDGYELNGLSAGSTIPGGGIRYYLLTLKE